jgi:hypothetical protein
MSMTNANGVGELAFFILWIVRIKCNQLCSARIIAKDNQLFFTCATVHFCNLVI